MSTRENKALARRLNKELWNGKTPDIIKELVAPNCVYHAGDREFRGQDGFRSFYDTYVTAFPDLSIQIDDLIAEGNQVAIRYTARGQHTGPLMSIPATGKQVTVSGFSVVRYKNGQLVEGRSLWNQFRLMQQIGVIPEDVSGKTPA